MTASWQEVRAEALRRIQTREWAPGALIPNEAVLANELGCARTTVNRALRALAEAGLLERRRKAGTRVALSPQRRAQLAIPLIREDIAARGAEPRHVLLSHAAAAMPSALRISMGLAPDAPTFATRTLYLADNRPFALEVRWVHVSAAPGYDTAPLDQISANEWLVQNAPFSHGTLDYSAVQADQDTAAHLDCTVGAPLIVLERRTFGPELPVTHMRLFHAPGYRLHLEI